MWRCGPFPRSYEEILDFLMKKGAKAGHFRAPRHAFSMILGARRALGPSRTMPLSLQPPGTRSSMQNLAPTKVEGLRTSAKMERNGAKWSKS